MQRRATVPASCFSTEQSRTFLRSITADLHCREELTVRQAHLGVVAGLLGALLCAVVGAARLVLQKSTKPFSSAC